MSLMKSLNSGVSGLRAFQTKMDVIGNNIANVETSGFKASRVTFTEMLSQQIGSGQASESAPSSANQVGLGTRISSIDRDFNQGGLQATGRKTDLAIEGKGFFMVGDGDQSYLTRDGNFAFNKEGFLVDQSGRMVQGYNAGADGEVQASGTPDDIRVDFENIFSPQATQNVYMAGNLGSDTSTKQVVQAQSAFTTDAGEIAEEATLLNDLAQTTTDFAVGDTIDFEFTLNDGTNQTITHTYAAGDTLEDVIDTINAGLGAEGTASLVDGMMVIRSAETGDSQFSLDNTVVNGTGVMTIPGFEITQEGSTGSTTVSSTVYDELGKAHTLMLELTQTDANTWEYEASFLDGEELTAGGNGTLTFDNTGNLTSDSALQMAFNPGNGANPVNFTLNLGNPENGSKVTQFAGTASAKITSQDGYAQGKLVDYNVDGDGYVNGVYDNGKNIKLAQVAVADVTNYNGLETLGNGLYRNTVASGDVSINVASNLSETKLNSGMLEGSNVDLAREFTDMITSQRAYQSNARVITTADELLAEAVNLKR
ncbi:MAG: flagellar hook protein FlgE [Balneolaceae bacterium]|nr:flagellar hook protein FlgE [Balneolaceae bacterium]